MKHRFPAALIVGLAMLTGVVSAASNASVRTAGISLVCGILLKAHALVYGLYRILIAH